MKAIPVLLAVVLTLAGGPSSADIVQHQFDSLDRLIQEVHGSGIVVSYTYDEVGNRISRIVSQPNTDTDGDGVPDEIDSAPNNQFVCRDADVDTCDDCSSGTDAPASDGPDADQDGICNAGDPDDDGDGILDDGDGSGIAGDGPCTGGNTFGCDDNCGLVSNPGQEDADGDGVGDACDVSGAICRPVFAFPVIVNSNARSGWTDQRPRVAADSSGSWMAVWHSDDDFGGTYGNDMDVFSAVSTDSGANWTTATPVNAASSDSNATHDEEPDIATDQAGNWVVAWRNSGGSTGSDHDLLMSRSGNVGTSWTPAISLNTNASSDSGFDDKVRVATDAVGNWVAVWSSNDALGAGLGTDVDILVATSTNQGASWSNPQPLNTNATTDFGFDGRPYVATSGAGTWIAIWESDDSLGGTIGTDEDVLVARSIDNGQTWSAPATLNESETGVSRADGRPHVATDGAGNWVAVWESRDSQGGALGTDQDLLVSRSADDGLTWSMPNPLNSHAYIDSATDYRPQVVTDGIVWVIVWRSDDSLLGTIGTDTDILVSYSMDAGASWTASAPLYDYAASDTGTEVRPHLSTDGNGSWVAVFQSNDPLGGTPEGNDDILASTSSLSCCGDGAVTAREECDDANSLDGDGCSSACELEDSWLLFGTAEGGSVGLTVDGVAVEVFTTSGEWSETVLQNIANAINSEPILSATGVSAFVVGNRLVTTGTLAEQAINDPGLTTPIPVPGLPMSGVVIVGLLLFALGGALARRAS